MLSKSLAAVLAPLLLVLPAFAQAPQMPQPAPELKKLDFFVGTWKVDADMKPSQFGPGGKLSSTDHIEWMQGNFFLLIHTSFTSAMGSGIELGVMGYDSANKVFTYTSFNSVGEHETATGTFDGSTWTWNSEQTSAPGAKWRYTQKILSPTSYSIKFEMSPNGGALSTVMEGTATKQ